jgi:UDPglucose 6-dehydrogenase
VDGTRVLPDADVAATPLDALEGADGAILATAWPELGELDWSEAARRMRTPLLVDGRNMLDPEALRAAGFDYTGIGRNGTS